MSDEIREGTACAFVPRRSSQGEKTDGGNRSGHRAAGRSEAEEQSYCMRPEQQITRSHLPQGTQGPLWAGGNKVGNYTNSEEAVPDDIWFDTPFEGTQIRDDGTAGIVTDKEDFTGITCPFTTRLPVEGGRYQLIWTPLCPWATRVIITLNLLGIGENVIHTIKADPVKTEKGWRISQNGREYYLPELYEKTDSSGKWNATVPTLFDSRESRVVNNDYHRLPLYLETVWKPFHCESAPDLYPLKLRSQIDRLDRVLFNDVGNRVYQAGFARSQAEYEHSFYIFFNRLNWLDRYLGRHRFLMGDAVTDPDIRLYVTLARLDAAYYFEFRLNGLRLRDFDNLWRYAKELYEIPAFAEATDFDAIKSGYYLGPSASNPFGIVADGPDESVWTANVSSAAGREAD